MIARPAPTRRIMSRSAGPPVARLIATGALAALLAACGSLGPTTSASTVAGKAPKHLRIVGGSPSPANAAGAAMAASPAAAGKEVAADSRLAMASYAPTYVVQGDLPALDGDAQAWVYEVGAAGISAEAVAKLAKVLGVTGEVAALSADQGGGFRAGPDDGSAPALYVSNDALGSWSYSPGASVASGWSGACGVAVDAPAAIEPATAPTTVAIDQHPECASPPPPAGVPSADQARAKALALAAAVGFADGSDVEVSGDDYFRSVTVFQVLDGARSPMSMNAGWGAAGALQWASGQLARPVKADRYPRVGTVAAVTALQEGMSDWFGGPMAAATLGGGVARSAAAPSGDVIVDGTIAITTMPYRVTTTIAITTSPAQRPATTVPPVTVPPVTVPPTAVPDGTTAGGETPSCLPEVPTTALAASGVATAQGSPGCMIAVDPPMTIEPMPPESVEPVVITITGARASFVQVYAEDGSIWLLPGYELQTTDGGSFTVPAIDKSYVEVVAPQAVPVTYPMIATTVPPPSAVLPQPATAVPEPALATTTTTTTA